MRLLLAQSVPFKDRVEELPAVAVVCHDEKHFVPLPNLTDINNIRVVNLTERSVLLLKLLEVSNLELMDCFDGDSLEGEPILSSVDHAEPTRSYFLLKVILLLDIALPGTHEHTLFYHYVFVNPLVYQVGLGILSHLI